MGDPFRIFFEFFGSANPWYEQIEQTNPMDDEIESLQTNARAQDVEVTVDCSLYEFYNGAMKEVKYKV